MEHLGKKEFYISSFDLNPRGQARLTTMANFFQELAYHHANELGFGYEDLKERGNTWVLSRMRIHMDRYPLWNEKILLETWPSGIDKLFALREFRILDAEAKQIGRASTAWLILDIHTHRLIRPREQFEKFKLIIREEKMFDTPLDKIALASKDEIAGSHRVVFSDLDILGHVNNVKYMEWCIDVATNSREINEIREFEINFSHEAFWGDHVEIRTGPSPSGDTLFLATREGDGQEIIRARLQWAE